MELRHLRYFVRLADELHFGRAAELLGISQPPLSQQIRQLETELGVLLFERSSRRVRLTEAGRLFLEEAKETLARADQAVSTARRAAEGEIGTLTIGLTASSLFVPAVSATLAEFRRHLPDVHLDLAERSWAAQHDGLAAGTLDFGFLRSARLPVLADGLAGLAVAEDRLVVVMAATHPLGASEDPLPVAALADEPMVHYPYDRPGFIDDLWRLFESARFRPRIVQETREISTLLGLVSVGLGITVLPGALRHLTMANLRYRPISDDDAVSRLWLLHNVIRPRPAARRFLAMLQAQLG